MKIIQDFSPEGSEAMVELRSSIHGERFLAKKEDVLRIISEGSYDELSGIFSEVHGTVNLSPYLGDWEKFNWSESLDYYLWSRRNIFSDSNINARIRAESQKELLSEYIAESAPPFPIPSTRIPKIHLIESGISSGKTLGQALSDRSCSTPIVASTLTLLELSQILFHGLTDLRTYRTPREGAEYISDLLKSFGRSFDFYLISYDIGGLAPGVYLYDVAGHSLVLQRQGSFREEMERVLIGHNAPKFGSASVLMVENFNISQWQYRHERAFRNLFYEAGRIMQRLLLASAFLEKNTHITPACQDSTVGDLLDLSPIDQQLFYALTLA